MGRTLLVACAVVAGCSGASIGTPGADAGGDEPPDAPIRPPPATPDAPVDFSFQAAVAECINPAAPSTADCRTANGNEQLLVDGLDSTTMQPWHAFVRFETSPALTGRMITSVALRMVVSNASDAMSSSSGEVFEVSAFSLASLSTTVPTKIGAALAPTQGAVAPMQVVEWPLPATVVKADGTVHLGVFPTVNDGANYFNTSGPMPPVLIVTAL